MLSCNSWRISRPAASRHFKHCQHTITSKTVQKIHTEMSKQNIPTIETSEPASEFVPLAVSRTELLSWFQEGKTAGEDFLLIDLRREDHLGGTIKGSINLPAQTLPSTISPFYTLISGSGITKAIFYCGSSRHRGTAAARLLQELLDIKADTKIKCCILSEGITGWVKGGGEFVKHMHAYEESHWR